jgi:hypothetical protein
MDKPTEATKQKASGRARWASLAAIAVLLAAGGAYLKVRASSGPAVTLSGAAAVQVPELPSDAARWVNGAPLQLGASRGQVVLIDGWHPT